MLWNKLLAILICCPWYPERRSFSLAWPLAFMPFNQFFYSKVPTENHRGQGRVSDICTNLTYPDILPEAYVQAVSSTKTVEKNENPLRLSHSHASHPVWKKMQLWPYDLYPTEPWDILTEVVPKWGWEIILQSWTQFNRKQYGVHLKKWAAFCSKMKIDSLDVSVK